MGTYIAEVEEPRADTPCSCDGCHWRGPYSALAEVEQAVLSPGDPSPAGRCPECDTLAYPVLRWTEMIIVQKIAARAVTLGTAKGTAIDERQVVSDLVAVHENYQLRLDDLLVADDAGFAHDVFGISENLNRETRTLNDDFCPRYVA